MFVWMRAWRGLAALLACGLPFVSVAQHDHLAMAGAAQPAALGFDAAFGAHDRLWVVSAHDGHVWLRHSDDFAQSLSAPTVVNSVAEKIAAGRENAPKIALGPQEQIYVSWAHPLGERFASDVRFARSVDGGKSFSAPVTINRGPAGVTHSFNSMMVSGDGNIVIAWLDGRDMTAAMAAGTKHHGLSLFYSWSADDGKSFASGRRVMDHTCECCRIALARAPDGRVVAMFRAIFGDNIRDHALVGLRTDAHPLHWQRATFSHWQVAACPEQGPGLAIARGGVRHAVWYEASHGPAIWYGQITPSHPPRHKLKLGGAGASHADVAVHADDVWIAWNQVDAHGYTLMVRVSHDGGAHFGPARAIAASTAAVASPKILVHGDRVFVAWNTASGFRLVAAGDQ